MDKKICPIFYAIMLHRRGRVDDITQNDLCMCLGERCMWFEKCENSFVPIMYSQAEKPNKPKKEEFMVQDPEDEETPQDEEPKDKEEKSNPFFADDESEFSKI